MQGTEVNPGKMHRDGLARVIRAIPSAPHSTYMLFSFLSTLLVIVIIHIHVHIHRCCRLTLRPRFDGSSPHSFGTGVSGAVARSWYSVSHTHIPTCTCTCTYPYHHHRAHHRVYHHHLAHHHHHSTGIVLVMLIIYGAMNLIPPFERFFQADDVTIAYPFTTHETVPTWLLFVRAVVGLSC